MKRASIAPTWLTVMLFATLALTACVRPVPQPDDDVPQDTPVEAPSLEENGESQPPEDTPVDQPSDADADDTDEVEEADDSEAGDGEDGGTGDGTAQADDSDVDSDSSESRDEPTSHTVVAGETIFTLAQRYNVSVAEIATANNLSDPNSLEIGQILIIPVAGTVVDSTDASGAQVHIVRAGENLFRIGLRYGIDYRDLAAYNGIANPNRISVGQEIRIPPAD